MADRRDKGITESISALGVSMEKARKRGWPYGAYGDALQLLEAMEDRLAIKLRIPRSFKRFLVMPLSLWMRGVEQMVISYGRFYGIAFVVGVAGLFLANILPDWLRLRAQAATFYVNLFIWLSLVFAAPSTYCSAGINAKHVDTAGRRLTEWEVDTQARVQLILENIHIFEKGVNRRLTVFRWLLGAAWAIVSSALITDAVKSWSSRGGYPSITDLATLYPVLGLLVGIFLIVEAYARGVDILFRTIELGCNERLASLERSSKGSGSS